MTTDPQSAAKVRAVIFDLDGTLADTERLKMLAYGEVTRDLTGAEEVDPRVYPLYSQFVGSTDQALCKVMTDQLDLREVLGEHAMHLGVATPWEALHALRMRRYLDEYGRPEEIARNAFQHNVALVKGQHAEGRTIAVATMSLTEEASRVLEAIGIDSLIELVVGKDQVVNPKPDPEIYLATVERLGLTVAEALVIEDSPTGVRAALAAGLPCVAVANDFTAEGLRQQADLDQRWIAYQPENVAPTVQRRIETLENAGVG